MKSSYEIAVLEGDGIGPEVVAQAVKVLRKLAAPFTFTYAPVGGQAYAQCGHPLPEDTIATVDSADAILFGAVGDAKYDNLEYHLRPEQAILGLRKHLKLCANLRPINVFSELINASPLKADLIENLDILIVRELTGDVYFGQPRGQRKAPDGEFEGSDEGFDTMRYARQEVERIARLAFQLAQLRNKKLTSVDKANVLETSRLWRSVVSEVATDYPDVTLEHMYVDNAAMQVVSNPRHFDVIVTGNLFGDILSDLASTLTGSIGMLPSASLNNNPNKKGLYEPIHGSAPDIAGKNIANPLATILSAAAMIKYSFERIKEAQAIEFAVSNVLQKGLRTSDITAAGQTAVSCSEMGDAVCDEIEKLMV